MTPKVTHTHPPEGRREALRSGQSVSAHAKRRQKNEDMKRGLDGTKVCVVAMKGNQVHRDNQ